MTASVNSQLASAPPLTPVTLAAQNVSFGFARKNVLEDVSCTLEPGKTTAIVGPNGCGKSTLLSILAGILRPRQGVARCNGEDVWLMPARQRAALLALVPQRPEAAFNFLVMQMVLMGRWAAGGAGAIAHADNADGKETPVARANWLGLETGADVLSAQQAMWAMDVHALADRGFHTLSGGERQRVVVARALAQGSAALLLDEPTAALDIYHQLELLALLKQMAEAGHTVVAVLHDVNAAAAWADHAVLMSQGNIVSCGAPEAALSVELLEEVYHVRVTRRDGRLEFQRQNNP